MEQQKKKKPRCKFRDGDEKCRKKTHMNGYKCKCEKIFCAKHRYPHDHKCTFDYKTERKKQIIANNPVFCNKIIKI